MTNTNPTLRRALRSLAHPLTIAAIITLLLNDHILRVLWPSWITGKLGDAAWLAFTPLMLALPLALIFPRRDRLVIALSVIVTGTFFTLIKTVPLANQMVRIGGFGTLLDPSDLLVLPTLIIAWLAWDQTRSTTAAPTWRHKAIYAVAALALIADAPAPPSFGITCLKYGVDGQIIAQAGGYIVDAYSSDDGGLTWLQIDARSLSQCFGSGAQTYVEADPNDSQIVYRVSLLGGAERSTDGGQMWQSEGAIIKDQRRLILASKNNADQPLDPQAMIIDRATGNVIVAMGWDGALVRTHDDGKWQWVTVGEYEHTEQPVTTGDIYMLISGELILSLAIAGAALRLYSILYTPFKPWGPVIAVVAVLIWLSAVLSNPAMWFGGQERGYIPDGLIDLIVLIIADIPCLILLVVSVRKLWGQRPVLNLASIFAAVSAVAFYAPYLVWASTGAFSYSVAQSAALILASLTITGGMLILRKTITPPEPEVG